ncbi:DUF817 domain-containing protein [Burkholderia sp. 3C]
MTTNPPVLAMRSRADATIEALAARVTAATRLRGGAAQGLHTFLVFGFRQAWVCLFGGLMVGLLIATHFVYPRDAALSRYDLLTLAAVAIQITLIALRLETWDEVKVILLFHVSGTAMEVFKTAVGSWVYPEYAVLRIGGVPLFTGFMYASVGSYLARAIREFDLRFTGHPPLPVTAGLSLAIYVNFFTHHYWFDLRYGLIALVAVAFRRCHVYYRVSRRYHRMPMLLGFLLIALFIWLAENVGTFSQAWLYPAQRDGWTLVSPSKLVAWFMLTIMSYVIVTLVNPPRTWPAAAGEAPRG